MKHFVYILQTRDGSFYTGLTKDLQARIDLHNEGKGAKFTKGRRPVKLVYYEVTKNLRSAIKREIEIKSFTKQRKKKLIEQFPRKLLNLRGRHR
jgi:putative endonuclease